MTYIYRLRTGEVGRTFAQVNFTIFVNFPSAASPSPPPPKPAPHWRTRPNGSPQVATGDCVPTLTFVAEQLAAEPERSDVVHDLLAHLAEQMITLNQQKGDEMRGFLAWLERETGAKIDDLTGKSQLQNYLGDYQKGEAPLAFDGDSWRSCEEQPQAGCRSGQARVPGAAQGGVRRQPGRAAAPQGAAGRHRPADRPGGVSVVRTHRGRNRSGRRPEWRSEPDYSVLQASVCKTISELPNFTMEQNP